MGKESWATCESYLSYLYLGAGGIGFRWIYAKGRAITLVLGPLHANQVLPSLSTQGKMKVWSTWLAWSTQSRIKNLPWYFVILKNKGWEKWQCCTFLPLNSSLAAKSEAAPLLPCMFGQHWAKDKVLPFKQWPPNVFPYPSFFCSIQEINFTFHSINEVWYQDLFIFFSNSLQFHLEYYHRNYTYSINYTVKFNAFPRFVTWLIVKENFVCSLVKIVGQIEGLF